MRGCNSLTFKVTSESNVLIFAELIRRDWQHDLNLSYIYINILCNSPHFLPSCIHFWLLNLILGQTRLKKKLFKSTLFKNLYTINYISSKCRIHWFLTVCTHETIATIKIQNIFIPSKASLYPICRPFFPSSLAPGNHWSAFCHYRLACIF